MVLFALIASAIGGGLDAVGSMLSYMLTVIAGLLLHALLIYSLTIWFLGRRNPITFYKGFFPAMTVAFSTASSNATLPVSMKAAQESLGVRKEINSFVQPLGATINMDGTAGVPRVGLIMLAMVLNQVDLPVEGIALIIGIDRILDMLRTSLNISGDAACAYILSEREKWIENKQVKG